MTLLDKNPVLREMYETATSITAAGQVVPLHSNLPREYAEALYRTVLSQKPALVVEIGMAMGTSSLAILSALAETGAGRLISIDPQQSTGWEGKGTAAVKRAGLSDRHELIEDYDYRALPRLLDANTRIDVAYIDGWHTFDYTLLDWWYIDRMLVKNGICAFNDCSWPAVAKAVAFVLSHRKYQEIDVGLPTTYSGKSGMLARIRGKKRLRVEDRYLRKTEDWEPSWDFFAPF